MESGTRLQRKVRGRAAQGFHSPTAVSDEFGHNNRLLCLGKKILVEISVNRSASWPATPPLKRTMMAKLNGSWRVRFMRLWSPKSLTEIAFAYEKTYGGYTTRKLTGNQSLASRTRLSDPRLTLREANLPTSLVRIGLPWQGRSETFKEAHLACARFSAHHWVIERDRPPPTQFR